MPALGNGYALIRYSDFSSWKIFLNATERGRSLPRSEPGKYILKRGGGASGSCQCISRNSMEIDVSPALASGAMSS